MRENLGRTVWDFFLSLFNLSAIDFGNYRFHNPFTYTKDLIFIVPSSDSFRSRSLGVEKAWLPGSLLHAAMLVKTQDEWRSSGKQAALHTSQTQFIALASVHQGPIHLHVFVYCRGCEWVFTILCAVCLYLYACN